MNDPQLDTEIAPPPLWCAAPYAQIDDLWRRAYIDYDTARASKSLLGQLELDPVDRPSVSVWTGGQLRLCWESSTHTVAAVVRIVVGVEAGVLTKRLAARITLKRGRWLVTDEEYSPVTPKLRDVLTIAYKTVFRRLQEGCGR